MISRTFVHAMIRRAGWIVGGVIVYAILSAFGLGVGKAHAQQGGSCSYDGSRFNCTTEEAAWASATEREAAFPPWAQQSGWCANPPQVKTERQGTARLLTFYWRCASTDGWQANMDYVWPATGDCPAGSPLDPVTRKCKAPVDCSTKAPLSNAWTISGASAACDTDGCGFKPAPNAIPITKVIDGITYVSAQGWSYSNEATCSAGSSNIVVPPPDGDGDGRSDGNDSAPQNPGESGPQPPPPACGGTGQPPCPSQESDPNASSGGGDCATPPNSTGDGILAQIAFQTWATRCEGEKGNANDAAQLSALNEIADGIALNSEGQGTDMSETNGILGQISGLLSNSIGLLDDIKNFLTEPGSEGDVPTLPEREVSGIEQSWSVGSGAGSCPPPVEVSIELLGHSQAIEFSFDPLCEFADMLYWLVVAMGAITSIYIISGAVR